LNSCSQRGLIERFDASIGAGSVFMPFGGKTQNTPMDTMVAKIPVLHGDTSTGTVMSYGFNPYVSSWSPYHGAVYSVIDSISKVVATGGRYDTIRFTFQEYFKRLGADKSRWGEPLAALLGAYYIQDALNLPSIGGKDSMSGTFNSIDVPPTLVSFAVNIVDVNKVVSNEFKHVGSDVVLLELPRNEHNLPDIDVLKSLYTWLYDEIQKGTIASAYSVPQKGVAEAIIKMGFGNQVGFDFVDMDAINLFTSSIGSIVIELKESVENYHLPTSAKVLGKTTRNATIKFKSTSVELKDALTWWEEPLEDIFPTKTVEKEDIINSLFTSKNIYVAKNKIAQPNVFIPVFPGTNCEYDSRIAFEKAGAKVNEVVFRNLTSTMVEQSVKDMVEGIKKSQIIMIPGGFSAGDEPDGSGKFIATVFRNPAITEAVMELLQQRDGLMLGICNGFQALIKLGLVPYGEIKNLSDEDPTLTFNTIGRHISRMATTKVMSNKSPWLQGVTAGDIHHIPVSHGEGRFVASEAMIRDLFAKGQVATTYVDSQGKPSMNVFDNPNGSMYGIEGLLSEDGRVLGKMGHSERIGSNVAKNIYGNQDQFLFTSGVNYFK